MTITRATIEDLHAMEPAAHRFYAASQFLRSFDVARFVLLWTTLLNDGRGVIFLAWDGDRIVGAIGGVEHPEAYSQAQIAQEFFWFIEPEHRGGGMRLYYAFENWARERGCDEIRMGHLHDLMPDKVAAVYRRLGFQRIETNYSKSLRQEARQLAG